MGMFLLFSMAVALWIGAGGFYLAWRFRHPPRKSLGSAMGWGGPESPEQIGLRAQVLEDNRRGENRDIGWAIDGGRRPGVLVVYTHAWGESRYVALRDEAAPLSALAERLYLYDMEGHGDRKGVYTCGEQDVEQVASMIKASDRPVLLVGKGIGAWLSLAAAAECPDGVKAVVAIDMPESLRHGWRRQIADWGWPSEPMSAASVAASRLLGWGGLGREVEVRGRQYRGPLLVVSHREAGATFEAHAQAVSATWPGAIAKLVPRGEPDGSSKRDLGGYVETLEQFLNDQGC